MMVGRPVRYDRGLQEPAPRATDAAPIIESSASGASPALPETGLRDCVDA